VRELGFPVLEADGWNGLFRAAKTPREVIDRLQKETAAAVRHPETAKRLMEIGAQAGRSTPAEQDAILQRQCAVQAGHPRNEDRELMKRLLLSSFSRGAAACGQTYPPSRSS